MSLASEIKNEARRLGFVHAGITSSEPPPHFPVYENWLEAGRQGEMHYLATESARTRRAEPRRILPECESILILAIPYDAAPAPALAESGRGQVAAYAWGNDYHEELVPRLKHLLAFIETAAGQPVPNRWYTDSGPILERDLAQRAGLGWTGKNTCLIHPEYGSYFFLAEILLGLSLDVDPPFTADHCGSCTRCIEICPTDCILPDRTLDASRCISYLTIELKGPIPVGLRPSLGNWIFGCDLCQQVCPWNGRFAPKQGDPGFAPRPGLKAPRLVDELALTPEAFNRKFWQSPVRRTKRRGYLRNVAVALGNQARPESVEALATALRGDPEPLVRRHAAWALGQIRTEAAARALSAVLETESDSDVRREIEEAIEAR